jgi:hypothetical protein
MFDSFEESNTGTARSCGKPALKVKRKISGKFPFFARPPSVQLGEGAGVKGGRTMAVDIRLGARLGQSRRKSEQEKSVSNVGHGDLKLCSPTFTHVLGSYQRAGCVQNWTLQLERIFQNASRVFVRRKGVGVIRTAGPLGYSTSRLPIRAVRKKSAKKTLCRALLPGSLILKS